MYLAVAVAVLGFGVYLSSFGPLFTAGADYFTPTLLDLAVVASIAAGLIAGVSLLPKQKALPAVLAVLSVLAFLLVIAIVLTAPQGVSIDWGLYLIIAFTVFQAIAAVAILLFDAGIISPPAPRQPRYEQQQYGQYGGAPSGQYYGHPQHTPPPQQGPPQRQGYPSQYGGYQSSGPSTGGYGGSHQSGPPTPPTGFPAYGQPPSSSAPTTETQTSSQSGASSTQSGPPPS
jgi:hypothetical protein